MLLCGCLLQLTSQLFLVLRKQSWSKKKCGFGAMKDRGKRLTAAASAAAYLVFGLIPFFSCSSSSSAPFAAAAAASSSKGSDDDGGGGDGSDAACNLGEIGGEECELKRPPPPVDLISFGGGNGDGKCEAGDEMLSLKDLVDAVDAGHLSVARSLALEHLYRDPSCERVLARTYAARADAKLLLSADDDDDDDGGGGEKYFHLIAESPLGTFRPQVDDVARCWVPGEESCDTDAATAAKEWDRCCSVLDRSRRRNSHHNNNNGIGSSSFFDACTDLRGNWRCCEFFPGSPSHRRLPAIHEPVVRIRLPAKRYYTVLELQQDGYLRPYDESSVLWPTGFLLSACLADPVRCGVPELLEAAIVDDGDDASSPTYPIAAELGAGIGAPSIALAQLISNNSNKRRKGPAANFTSPPLVVATDYAPHGLALTLDNAKANRVAGLVGVRRVDHYNATSLAELRNRYFPLVSRGGFAVVVGSSLKALFSGTGNPDSHLWTALDVLLDQNNPNALAIFVHTRSEPLQAPIDGRYKLMRRLPSSCKDFEIAVFRKSRPY